MTKRTFRCRFIKPNGYYTFIEVSGANLTEEKAERRAKDYISANSQFKMELDEIYEINIQPEKSPESTKIP